MLWPRLVVRLFAFAAALALPALSGAQTVTGSLVGTIQDSTGAVVPGATVVATETGRGTPRETTSNAQGRYTLSSLEPGVYRVEVRLSGFKTFVRAPVPVTINTTARVDARLEAGAVEEVVEVKGERALLQTDRADLRLQIPQVQVAHLPLSIDRNYQSLLELVPGATQPEPTGSALGNPAGGMQYSVNGQNIRANSDQVDGTINNMTNTQARIVVVPPPEAIEVIDVSTNAYDAEHGRAMGAVVNVQLKSGTNQFHGSVFGYNTNSAFAAQNALSRVEPPETNLNQFGFTAGGPIWRNRTFFFGDYQGGRDRRAQTALLTVPTAVFRNGDFRAASTAIYDPATGTATGTGRRVFPNNVIPSDRISAVAREVLNRLPLPNRSGLSDNYDVAGTFRQQRDAFDVKINHRFTGSTDGFVSYSFFNADTQDPPVFGDLGGPNFGGTATAAVGSSRSHRMTMNLTHTLSPTLLTEARVGLLRSSLLAVSPTQADIADEVGIPGIYRGDLLTSGLPRIRISGYDFLGIVSSVPFDIPERSFNVVNNWTKAAGSHTIRWGADLRYLMSDPMQVGNTRGDFVFSTGVTGTAGASTSSANAFASFLLGLPQQIVRDTLVKRGGYRIQQYFFFAQDRWQASPNLTLNYGLRYEIVPFASAKNAGGQSFYLPESNQIIVAGLGPYNLRTNVETDFSNFAPRLGVTYRLGDKTVLRGGYGISYAPFNFKNTGGFPAEIGQEFRGRNSRLPAGALAGGIPPPPEIDVSNGVVDSPPGTLRLTATNFNPDRGYTQSYNVAIEREFGGFVGEIAYVGSKSTNLPAQTDINTAGPGESNADRPFAKQFGRTATTTFFDYMLPQTYHAMQTKLQRRFGADSLFTVAYTLSRSIDYAQDLSLANNLVLELNRGLSRHDRTHNLVVSHIFRLPFGPGQRWLTSGVSGALLGGWQVNGIFAARSGLPVDIFGNRLTANDAPGNRNRPDLVAQPTIPGGIGPDALYFDTSAFTEPAPGTWGNLERNSAVRGPGYANYNASLFRAFELPGDVRLQFRAEAFNLTNTPHYRNPVGNFESASFGKVLSSYGERQVRFALRLEF